MKLILADRADACLCHRTALVAGFSFTFTDGFETCYRIGNIDFDTEYLQEEVARRIERLPSLDNGPHDWKFSVNTRRIARSFRPTIPLNLVHPYNYFHFLIESLPSLHVLIKSGIANNDHLIVSGLLHPNMRDALDIVTERKLTIFELRLFDYIESEQTILSRDTYQCNERMDGKMPDRFEYIGSNLLALREHFDSNLQLIPINAMVRLFVIRESHQRNVVNLGQLAKIASDKGFLVINPAQLSFVEQVRIFRNARAVIGPTGAWLANLMFVRNDCNVCVLYPETCRIPKSIWSGLGDIFGVTVIDQYFPIANYCEAQPIHSDFYVDPKIFGDLLDNL